MIEFSVDNITIQAETKPDLFSPKGLDRGTRLLLGCLPKIIDLHRANIAVIPDSDPGSVPVSGSRKAVTEIPDPVSAKAEPVRDDGKFSLLDWGCGWGAIGLFAAQLNPEAQITAIDSDIAAVKTTTANAELNELTNLKVIASHSYDELGRATYDIIASNPPTHRGREVVDTMIAEAKTHLNPGGTLLLVVEARIKPWVARQMKASFGDYRIVKRGPKNVVLMAVKKA